MKRSDCLKKALLLCLATVLAAIVGLEQTRSLSWAGRAVMAVSEAHWCLFVSAFGALIQLIPLLFFWRYLALFLGERLSVGYAYSILRQPTLKHYLLKLLALLWLSNLAYQGLKMMSSLIVALLSGNALSPGDQPMLPLLGAWFYAAQSSFFFSQLILLLLTKKGAARSFLLVSGFYLAGLLSALVLFRARPFWLWLIPQAVLLVFWPDPRQMSEWQPNLFGLLYPLIVNLLLSRFILHHLQKMDILDFSGED